MTDREKAIIYFKDMRKRFCEDYLNICPKDSTAYKATLAEKDFYDTAIEALQQEPCEDCISREAVMHILDEVGGDFDSPREAVVPIDCIADMVSELPPVTPQPKMGWIPVSERLPEKYKEVIVTDNETSDTYQSQYIGNGYWECDTGRFKNRIIAWMPLPQPYKSEIPTGAEGSEKE